MTPSRHQLLWVFRVCLFIGCFACSSNARLKSDDVLEHVSIREACTPGFASQWTSFLSYCKLGADADADARRRLKTSKESFTAAGRRRRRPSRMDAAERQAHTRTDADANAESNTKLTILAVDHERGLVRFALNATPKTNVRSPSRPTVKCARRKNMKLMIFMERSKFCAKKTQNSNSG